MNGMNNITDTLSISKLISCSSTFAGTTVTYLVNGDTINPIFGSNGCVIEAKTGTVVYSRASGKTFVYNSNYWEELGELETDIFHQEPIKAKPYNCINCGAPLKNKCYCEYCGTEY